MTSNRKMIVREIASVPDRKWFNIPPGVFSIIVVVVFTSQFTSSGAGVPQMTIAGLVGQAVELPCTVDAAKCGELHSIKWYRGLSRIFVFSESAKISKSEGNFTDRAELQYDHNATQSSLRIKPLHVTDEALYKCEITYIEVREECSVVQFINLITQIKPEYLRIIRSDESEVQNSSLIGPFSEGDKFSLLCESGGGKPVPIVEWWNGSVQINGDKQMEADSNGIGTGRNKIKITIGRGDLGAKYECRARNDALDEPIVSWVELDVNVRPLKMVLTGVEHQIIQGTKVLLQCIIYGARPAANVTWYNGTEIMREDLVSTTSAVKADGTYETQSHLVFTASRFENGGMITCEAINSVMIDKDESSMKSTLVLEVLYPPIVLVSPLNITVNESTDILLFCSYESNPTTLKSVKWLRDGVQVELDPERFEDGSPDQPNLLIKNTTRFDQGVYTCVCENDVGSTESSNSIYVNILYKPSVKVVIDPPPPVNELDKVNALVICEVTAGNPDVLQAVRWYLNGTLLRELPECSPDNDTFCDIDPSHLLLEPAIRDLHGNYSCEGMNEAGWGPLSEDSEFIVYYPPGPATLVYEPQRVVKGKSVNFLCLVEDLGRPPSDTFRWIRGNHHIQDVTSSNWTIDPVTLETEANFTCSAYNLGGEGQSSSASIEVFAPPAFIERLPPYYGALMSAQQINVSCRVECSPLCTVSWLKNGRPIEKTAGSSTLYSVKNTVVPADPSTNDFNSVQSTLLWNMNAWPGGQLDRIYDNANYTCQSTGNTVGGGVRSTTIFGVEYPPENITLSSKVISVVEGQEMHEKVTCQAKAYPEASYLWRKEGETETITKGNILMLRYQVPRKDGGNYVCEAYNRHGNVTGKTFVNVLFKPECAITQTEQNGKPVLICTAHANPTEVDFTWKIKNENETVEDSIENKGLQSFLTLETRIENFRTYLCFANNSVGMSIPCERDVTGKAAWWPMFENDNLLIVVAIIVGAILMFLLVCVIIILVCRKKRAEDKYNKSVELEERENYESYERFIQNLYGPELFIPTEGNTTHPVIVQQQPIQNSTVTPKWPLKPGVLVHANGARFNQGLATSLTSLPKTSTPNSINSNHSNGGSRSRSNKKIWHLQRRRTMSLGSLAQPDDTSQRSRAMRIKKMFSHERSDSLPNGFYYGKSGVVTFRRIEVTPTATVASRKRKKPGDGEKKVATADKLGLDPRGSHCDGLDERAFYENLPFHGMQNPPTKNGCVFEIISNKLKTNPNTPENVQTKEGVRETRSLSSLPSATTSAPEGEALRKSRRRVFKSNTVRVGSAQTKSEPTFHSLRIYKKSEHVTPDKIARIQTTSAVLLKQLQEKITPPENFKNAPSPKGKEESTQTQTATPEQAEEVPSVPDRKSKPKFLNGRLKFKDSQRLSDTEDTFLNDDDNESLISGVERLSNSPAPVPAPRKLVSTGLTKLNFNAKHTYQNVPIPISPNNSQDLVNDAEKSLEARHYKLTSSQQHLLPLNNKKHSHQAAYNLLQDQGKLRHSGRRNKHDANSLRSSRKQSELPPGYTVNGSLRQNQLFFNSLRDVNKQVTNNQEGDFKNRTKSDVKNHKEFREKTRERLKDSTPLQVMRFKELLTAGGENYNRQSNSDSSGERRVNTDSSSGDTEMPISDSRHFKNISSGEESLLRDCSKSSYMTIPGDHEIFRPIPINGAKLERRGETNSLERGGRSLDRRESQRTYVPPTTLPLQSYYTPMGSDPLLLPHYAPLASDLTPNSEPRHPPAYTSGESDATPAGSDASPLGSDPYVKNSIDYAELSHAAAVADARARSAQVRNTRNTGSDLKRNSEYASLKFHDVGQEIDV